MNNISTHYYFLMIFLVLFSNDLCAQTLDERPNIIFIMTDDHTKQAMSAYGGSLMKTPNLDRIANEEIGRAHV